MTSTSLQPPSNHVGALFALTLTWLDVQAAASSVGLGMVGWCCGIGQLDTKTFIRVYRDVAYIDGFAVCWNSFFWEIRAAYIH